MQIVLYNFALTIIFLLGITTMIQPHRQTHRYMHTLEDIQRAGIDFIGAHCNALPDTVTDGQLQESNNLTRNFDNQGVVFTWQLAEHPIVSINASGNADYLAFLAGHTLGEFEMGNSYPFIPYHDMTLFRAANSSYNLFAYAGNDFSCESP